NQPNTAIIGFGAIQKRPVAREYDGEYFTVIRDMVYISMTFDHRVIDGMLAGECLAQIIKNVEAMNEGNLVL
ncbi:MAG: 2-oxo acid dehydrogenase subunit E2, partial [FCB group bacterium]